MAELGTAAAVLQIGMEFVNLLKKLQEAYKGLRYAREEVHKVMDKTEVMSELADLFEKTMKQVAKHRDLKDIRKRYRKVERNYRKQAKGIIKKIKGILNVLSPLWTHPPAQISRQLYARVDWHFRKRHNIQILLTEMQSLEISINGFTCMINIQIALRQAKTGSLSKMQLYFLEANARLALMKLERNQAERDLLKQKTQGGVYPPSAEDFAKEVLRILKNEMPELLRNMQNGSSSPPSLPPSLPPLTPPVTPPVTPPEENRPSPAAEPEPEQDLPNPPLANVSRISIAPHDIRGNSESEVSYISVDEMPSSPRKSHPPSPEKSPAEKIYVATALMGGPARTGKPPPRRKSTPNLDTGQENTESSQGLQAGLERSRSGSGYNRRSHRGSPEPLLGNPSRRQARRKPRPTGDVYGNEGEVSSYMGVWANLQDDMDDRLEGREEGAGE